MMKTSMGYQILEGRYALLDCLAVSSIGEVYRARDLERAQTHGAHSLVTIHILPKLLSETMPIAALFQQVAATAKQLHKPWILAPLRFGLDSHKTYMVLDYPNTSGSLQSVTAMGGQNTVMQRRASSQLGYLVGQHYLKARTEAAFLLVGKDPAMYVLATAFAPALQALQNPQTSLTLLQAKPWFKVGLGVLAMMIALGTVTAAVLHEQLNAEKALKLAAANSVEVIRTPVITTPESIDVLPTLQDYLGDSRVLITPVLKEPRLKNDPVNDTQVVPSLAMQAVKDEAVAALPHKGLTDMAQKKAVSESNQVVMASSKSGKSAKESTNKSAASKKLETKVLMKRELAKRAPSQTETPKLEPLVVLSAPMLEEKNTGVSAKGVVQADIVKSTPAQAAFVPEHTIQVMRSVTATQKVMPKAAAPQPALSLEELLRRADEALAKGLFSSAQQGVLYYVRAIRDIAPFHPAVDRLSREVVLYQHEKIRDLLLEEDFNQAQHLLNSSANLIREFNLKPLNAAQQILEHKASQLG